MADIVRYIAQHNPDAAVRMGFALITRAESLTQFPEIGRSVPEFHLPDLREIICRFYRIIYRLKRDEQCIQIVRFWHGARDSRTSPEKTDPPTAQRLSADSTDYVTPKDCAPPKLPGTDEFRPSAVRSHCAVNHDLTTALIRSTAAPFRHRKSGHADSLGRSIHCFLTFANTHDRVSW